MNRREAIFSLSSIVASLTVLPKLGSSAELHNVPLETALNTDHLPQPAWQQGLRVLTNEIDRRNLAAVFDRLIPADEYGPSASEAGCIEFIDSELAGDYGAGAALYLHGPMKAENEEAIMGGPQFLASPRERYLTGLKALEEWSQHHYRASFYTLDAEHRDKLLSEMESGEFVLAGINAQAFFELMLQNVREGYLADPIYGGNKEMAGWKMIGFPGARYDYRPYIERRGEKLNLIPVSLIPND